MKITMYELFGMIKDGKAPKKIKYNNTIYNYSSVDEFYYTDSAWSLYREFPENGNCLNDEIEILEEEKKFTKEDFIKERMDLEGITREHFDKRYKVEECNCGMPYCKGFRAIEREEKKIPEKLISWFSLEKDYVNVEYANYNFKTMYEKINDICDYLKSKGE